MGSKAREGAKGRSLAFVLLDFQHAGCQKKSVVYGTECRHAAVQRGKQDQNHKDRLISPPPPPTHTHTQSVWGIFRGQCATCVGCGWVKGY